MTNNFAECYLNEYIWICVSSRCDTAFYTTAAYKHFWVRCAVSGDLILIQLQINKIGIMRCGYSSRHPKYIKTNHQYIRKIDHNLILCIHIRTPTQNAAERRSMKINASLQLVHNIMYIYVILCVLFALRHCPHDSLGT